MCCVELEKQILEEIASEGSILRYNLVTMIIECAVLCVSLTHDHTLLLRSHSYHTLLLQLVVCVSDMCAACMVTLRMAYLCLAEQQTRTESGADEQGNASLLGTVSVCFHMSCYHFTLSLILHGLRLTTVPEYDGHDIT